MQRIFLLLCALCASIVPLYAAVTISLPTNGVSFYTTNNNVVTFTNAELSVEPGVPELPLYRVSVLLPPNADLATVTCRIEGGTAIKVADNIDVVPGVPWVNGDGGVTWPVTKRTSRIVDNVDMNIYGENQFFPMEAAELVETGKLACYNIASISVYLFKYNPVTRELYKLDGGNLVVNYRIDASYAASNSSQTVIAQEMKNRMQDMVVNADQFAAEYDKSYTLSKKTVLAIAISVEDKAQLPSFDKFVDAKKNNQKIDVIVVTDDMWGSGTGTTAYTNLRKWLQDNYTSKGINNLLIIGSPNISTSKVPMWFFTGYANWGSGFTPDHNDCEVDWGYEQLTGTDCKSDKITELHVGRIPIYSNYPTVDSILQKTIAYIKTAKADAAWRYNALLAGPGYKADRQAASGPLNQAYTEFIAPNPPWAAVKNYTGNIATDWKAKSFSVVSWGTHGSETSAVSVFSSSNAATVGNKYPSFVMCGSCLNAAISTSTNLSYSVLKNCGMGAIGGTDYTVVSGDLVWIKSFVGRLVKDSMTVGECMSKMKTDCSFGWMNRAPYVLYGDPSVGVYTYDQSTSSTLNDFAVKAIPFSARQIVGHAVEFSFGSNEKATGILKVYSPKGALVATLSFNNAVSGVKWDLTATPVSTGIYIATLTMNTHSGVAASQSIKFRVSQ